MAAYSLLSNALLGYAAIYVTISLALFFLRRAAAGHLGLGCWSLSYLLNGIGFFLWSGVASHLFGGGFLIGDAFHVAGILTLIYGIYRFIGDRPLWPFAVGSAGAVLAWMGVSDLVIHGITAGFFLSALLRSLVFLAGSVMVFRGVSTDSRLGRPLAGWTLLVWSLYVLVFPLVMRKTGAGASALGLQAGLQLLTVLGLVMLIMDRVRTRSEHFESSVVRYEVLLSVCSYCKRIRDEYGEWHSPDSCVTDHSMARFSHGICPDCARERFPTLGLVAKER